MWRKYFSIDHLNITGCLRLVHVLFSKLFAQSVFVCFFSYCEIVLKKGKKQKKIAKLQCCIKFVLFFHPIVNLISKKGYRNTSWLGLFSCSVLIWILRLALWCKDLKVSDLFSRSASHVCTTGQTFEIKTVKINNFFFFFNK